MLIVSLLFFLFGLLTTFGIMCGTFISFEIMSWYYNQKQK